MGTIQSSEQTCHFGQQPRSVIHSENNFTERSKDESERSDFKRQPNI